MRAIKWHGLSDLVVGYPTVDVLRVTGAVFIYHSGPDGFSLEPPGIAVPGEMTILGEAWRWAMSTWTG